MGVIDFRHEEDAERVNPRLMSDLHDAADALGFSLFISCAITDHDALTTSGNPSRHMLGNAVDVSMINGACLNNAPVHFKERGDALCDWLVKNRGYQRLTYETGHDKVVLWQCAAHFNHLHVSNRLN